MYSTSSVTKSQHKRTTVASCHEFQNGISQNTKCAIKDGFCRDSHILVVYSMYYQRAAI